MPLSIGSKVPRSSSATCGVRSGARLTVLFRGVGLLAVALLFGSSSHDAAAGAALTEDDYVLLLQQRAPGGDPDAVADQLVEKADRHDAAVQFSLGTALMRKKFHPQAAIALGRAAQLAPENVLAHAHLGISSFWLERCDLATGAFERALALAAGHSDAWYWHNLAGRCHLHLRDHTKAVHACRQAAALRASDPRGELCIAKAQLAANNPEAALAGFLRVKHMTTEQPYAADVRNGVLVSLARLRRLDQAVGLLRLNPQEYPSAAALEQAAAFAAKTIENLAARQWWQN
jgi:tetratricopeptide (TPR) repeat protein